VVEVKPLGADNTVPSDASATRGLAFQTAFPSCVDSNGYVGRCMSSDACLAQTSSSQSWIADQTSSCGGFNPNDPKDPVENGPVCCVPNNMADSGQSTDDPWFAFTSPIPGTSTPVFAGSYLPISWVYNTATDYSSLLCSIDRQATFQLDLVLVATGSLLSWLAPNKAVQSFPNIKLSTFYNKIPITTFVEGTYKITATFSSTCSFSSRDFKILVPGCQNDPSQTYLGQCLPASQCTEQNHQPSACTGIQGDSVTCCYKTRSGMDPSFLAGPEPALPSSANIGAIAVSLLSLCGLLHMF